jgi:hypothetical protein
LAAFRAAAKTATDLARQHLLTIEGKIRELDQAASASQPPEADASGDSKGPPASGSTTDGDLTELRVPSAAWGEGVDDPKSPAKGGTDGYQLIPPAQAAEASSGSPLQLMLLEAMRKQREELQRLMKELDNGR